MRSVSKILPDYLVFWGALFSMDL